MKFLFILLFLSGCASNVRKVEVDSDFRKDELTVKLEILKEEAKKYEDANGWLVHSSCDAMLWAGKYCYAVPKRVKLEAAESITEPGRFYRTPKKDCYTPELGDNGSKSSWSRDMAMGMIPCAYHQRNLKLIDRHIKYGERTKVDFSKMGDGDPARTYYTPGLVGLLYKTARQLGHNHRTVNINNVYTKGLDDYQAHLQMLDIWHMGNIDGTISKTMVERIKEHSKREPKNTFYQAMNALYVTNNWEDAINLCLDDTNKVGSYVRCDGEQCDLAERLFSCQLIFDHTNN